MYMYIYYMVHSISFHTFFAKAIKIVIDSWKFSMLLLYISWLGLGLGLQCWGFKGVQEEIPCEEASTLQIGAVAFPPGQCTSPQLILFTDYLTKMGIKTVPIVQTLVPVTWLFPKLRGCRYVTTEEMKEAVTKVIDMLTQEDFHGAFQKLLEWYNKCIAVRGDYFEGD